MWHSTVLVAPIVHAISHVAMMQAVSYLTEGLFWVRWETGVSHRMVLGVVAAVGEARAAVVSGVAEWEWEVCFRV